MKLLQLEILTENSFASPLLNQSSPTRLLFTDCILSTDPSSALFRFADMLAHFASYFAGIGTFC